MSRQHYTAATYEPRTSIGYLVKRCHALLRDTVEPALDARGFTYIQYVILTHLREGMAINPKDFCAEFRHDSGAFTRVIDRLAERGLLDRVRGVTDRRKVELQLTTAGRKAVESLIPLVVEQLNLALGDFSAAELSELACLLGKLNHTMEGQLAGASP